MEDTKSSRTFWFQQLLIQFVLKIHPWKRTFWTTEPPNATAAACCWCNERTREEQWQRRACPTVGTRNERTGQREERGMMGVDS